MMLPELTEAMVREGAAAETFRRGQDYHREGAVGEITRRGDLLQAEVEGSDIYPYTVSVRTDAAGLIKAGCTCPYEWGGWCKHIVAVLLTLIDDPDAVEERPSLDTLLAGAGEDRPREIVRRLVETSQGSTETIEGLLVRQAPAATTAGTSLPEPAPAKNTAAAVKAARREIRDEIAGLNRLRPSEAYWLVGGVVNGVRGVLTQVKGYLNDGDAATALAVLDAITDEYLSVWEGLDDSDGDASAFFYDLGPIWAEALLSVELDAKARQDWTRKLNTYARDLSLFGVDDIFDSALVAIEEGWDAPSVRQALAGQAPDMSGDDEYDDTVDDLDLDEDDLYLSDGGFALVQARLNVLERQGRFDEFLNVAGAMGVPDRKATMLVRLGRSDEALSFGLERLSTADDALTLARAFREGDDAERALHIAEHGLSLPGKWSSYNVYQAVPPLPGELAIWTRDLAAELGQPELALRAARIAFEHEMSLGSYLRAQEIAGDAWEALKPDLLAFLREHPSVMPGGHVDIYLHEGLIGEAVAAVSDAYDWGLKARVADAAAHSHPEWVAAMARRRAYAIMDEGRSSHYAEAVAWLKRAGEAERVLGHIDAWRAELDDLIAKHARKYKLRPMLDDLRRRT